MYLQTKYFFLSEVHITFSFKFDLYYDGIYSLNVVYICIYVESINNLKI